MKVVRAIGISLWNTLCNSVTNIFSSRRLISIKGSEQNIKAVILNVGSYGCVGLVMAENRVLTYLLTYSVVQSPS